MPVQRSLPLPQHRKRGRFARRTYLIRAVPIPERDRLVTN